MRIFYDYSEGTARKGKQDGTRTPNGGGKPEEDGYFGKRGHYERTG